MAILTVTNDNDSGTGSLRAELAAAAAGDTINFASNVTTIDLDSSLVIAKNVTVEGAQPGSTMPGVTINGGGSSSNFFSDFVVDAGVTASIDGLIIADGNAKGGTSKEFVGNYGTSGSGGGAAGGIYVKGDLTLSNTFLQNDSATGGTGGAGTDGLSDGGGAGGSAAGAIYVARGGSVDLASNDVFTGNSAAGGSGGHGGGGYNNQSYYFGGAGGAGGVSGVNGGLGSPGTGVSGPFAGGGGAPADPGSPGHAGSNDIGAGGGGGGGTAFADVGGQGTVIGTAETDVVTNDSDNVNTIGSLPYELANAAPGATITFEPWVTTIDLSGSLVIAKNVTIEGLQPGATTPGVTINGGGVGSNFSDFEVGAGVTASIDGLIIANGYKVGADGVYNVSRTGQNGSPAAGGIYDAGSLTLTNSVLANDQAVGGSGADGSFGGGGGAGGTGVGGIYVTYGASLHLASNDAFGGNSAIGGGGGRGGYGDVPYAPGQAFAPWASFTIGGAGGIGGISFLNNGVGQSGSAGQSGVSGGAPGEPGSSEGISVHLHDDPKAPVDYFSYAPGGGGGGGFAFANVAGPGTITGYVPCYCRGTLIKTVRGERRVEKLKIGDKVMTASGVTRPIKWIGTRSYGGRFIRGSKEILPICIKAGALDDNVPRRDLWISPHHAMYFKNGGLHGALIEAKDLVNGVSIVQAEQVDKVEYFHIELDSHDVIVAEGALSETYIDDDNRAMFHNKEDYDARYRDGAAPPVHYCAPRLDEGYDVEAVRRHIALRAGLLRTDDARIETLRGHVDCVSGLCISGWAQSTDRPDTPVCLDIFANGRLIGEVLANLYRADLEQAGVGTGHHGFEFALPAASSSDTIEVRRSLDGAAIAVTSDPAGALALAARESGIRRIAGRPGAFVKVYRRAGRA